MQCRQFNILLLALLPALPALAGDFDCMIEPRKSVEVRAASEGMIEKIWVDRGDMVKAGQVLVTLDSGVEKAATESARYRATMQGKIRTGESRVRLPPRNTCAAISWPASPSSRSRTATNPSPKSASPNRN